MDCQIHELPSPLRVDCQIHEFMYPKPGYEPWAGIWQSLGSENETALFIPFYEHRACL